MKPHALICYRPDMVAQICAWCPDKKAADEIALVRGYELNHTICDACAAKLKADLPRPLRAEKSEPSESASHASAEEINEDAKRRAEFIHGIEDWLKRNS